MTTTSAIPKRQILIAEDSATQAESLRRLLESNGYVVTVAENGRTALREAFKNPPDMLISDVMMPEMSGYELCQALKAEAQFENTPIILLTQLSQPNEILNGLTCGADNFIVKPYAPDHLLTRIRSIFETRSLRETARMHVGVEVIFGGQRHVITSERQQILDLLIDTYETAVMRNAELIATQQQLRSLNERLEDKVTQRTLSLEKSNKELEDLLYVTSHDLQEPIRTIVSYCQLLEESVSAKLDENEKTYLGFLMDGGRRLQQQITDLLSYSRIISGTIEITEVDLNSLASHSVGLLHDLLAKRHAVVTHADLPTIRGSEAMLLNLLQQLIRNAVIFNSSDKPVVSLKGIRENDKWRISVKDNGIGIDAKYHDKIFALFRRLHKRTAYPGSGIGLSIAKKIAERHGGSIEVESQLGEGSTFHLLLPA